MGVPLGCSPLQKLELSCGSWTGFGGTGDSGSSGRGGSKGNAGGSCSGSPAATAAHLAELLASCPQLKSLQVLSASSLGPGLVAALVARCRLLSRLSVTDCCQVSNADVALLGALPALIHLNLSGCSAVGDAGLQAFAAGLRVPHAAQPGQGLGGSFANSGSGSGSLVAAMGTAPAGSAGLPGPRDPTQPGTGGSGSSAAAAPAAAPAAACSIAAGTVARPGAPGAVSCFLQSLKLDGCSGVTDAGLKALLPLAPHLATLSLRGLRGVTDATAAVAPASCANLRSLLLAGSGVRGGFLDGLSRTPSKAAGFQGFQGSQGSRDPRQGGAVAHTLLAGRGPGSAGEPGAGHAPAAEGEEGLDGRAACVACLGLAHLELPQPLRARLHGSAGLGALCNACPQLTVRFA
jgi:hypothetical protein